MAQFFLRWTLFAVAVFAVGPLAGSLFEGLYAVNGAPAVTMLVSASPASTVFATVAAFAIAAIYGLVTARLVGAAFGFFTTGAILAWAAWQAGPVSEILRAAGANAPLTTFAIEGLILGLAGAGLAWLQVRIARPVTADQAKPTEPLISTDSAVGLLVTILVGAAVAWILAREGRKGQTIAAAGGAALLAATAARGFAHNCATVSFFLGIALLAAIGPVATGLIGGADILAHAYANTLFPLGWISPLDWIAGAFMGIPLGMTWAGSMIEKQAPATA
ncbi:MAG: hypothetical protein VYC34_09070 [Planctomycetota bacterium]|nr:hypothetical protein [Planctomycetota bacterium]